MTDELEMCQINLRVAEAQLRDSKMTLRDQFAVAFAPLVYDQWSLMPDFNLFERIWQLATIGAESRQLDFNFDRLSNDHGNPAACP